MWKTPDGVAHTVVLPDPASAMQDDFIESQVRLGPDDRRLLMLDVVEAEERFYDLLDDIEMTAPTSPDEDALPDGYLQGSYSTRKDVAAYLAQIEPLWRLDSLMAVEEHLGELNDSQPTSWLGRLRSNLRL